MENKKKIAVIATAILLLVASVGLSFAYFTANLSGGETGETIVVSGGTLNIVYADHNPNIEVSDIIPQSEPVATKTFTVTGNNTTDLTMPYYLSLVVDNNEFSSNAITYTLTSTNTSSSGTPATNILTNQLLSKGSGNYALGNGSFVKGVGKIHTYELKLYFLDTGTNQNINQGKTFKAHVFISNEPQEPTIVNNCNETIGLSNQIYEPAKIGTDAYIHLQKNSGDIRVYGSGELSINNYGYWDYIFMGYFAANRIELFDFLVRELSDAGYIQETINAHPTKAYFEELLDKEVTDQEFEFILCQLEYMANFADEHRDEWLASVMNNDAWSFSETILGDINYSGNLIIEEGIVKIGAYDFSWNNSLGVQSKISSVTLPNSLTEIDEGAFRRNQISLLTIPANVTTIGSNAFEDNTVTSVTVLGSNPQRFNANWTNIFSSPYPPMP